VYREQRAVGSSRRKSKIRGAQCTGPGIVGRFVNRKRSIDNRESNALLVFPMPFSSVESSSL
jgi:hypothetical protein